MMRKHTCDNNYTPNIVGYSDYSIIGKVGKDSLNVKPRAYVSRSMYNECTVSRLENGLMAQATSGGEPHTDTTPNPGGDNEHAFSAI